MRRPLVGALLAAAWCAAASLDWIGMPGDTLLDRSLLLAAKGVVAGAIEGAGTAWLLDRLYFRPPV